MTARLSFYSSTIDRWFDARGESVLVVAGGPNDRDVFRSLGFTDVTITNLDGHLADVEPFTWDEQDVEALTYADGAFDHVVVHAGLHHCHSPHRGLSEMYRVARKTVVVFEPPDTPLTRVLVRLGLAQRYEVGAVLTNGGVRGGVAGSQVPNHVYRWSRREVRHVMASMDPTVDPVIEFASGVDTPSSGFVARSSRLRRLAVRFGFPAFRRLATVVPAAANLFAFRIVKPSDTTKLKPWLRRSGDGLSFVGSPADG